MAPHASRSASRRGWARRAPAAALVATSLVLSTLALLHEGVTTAEVDVNDGGIWVTNQSRGLVGHLNYDSRTLDAALRADSTDFDIAQHADTVTFSDHASRAVAPIEVAAVRLGAATSLAERAEAVQGGDRLGILDAGEGTLWVASAAEPSSTPLTPETAVADNLEGGVVSAGVEGTVMAVSATTSRLTTVTRDGTVDRVETTEIEGLATDAQLSLTAVGALPVALDATSNTLVLPDGRTRDLSAEGVPTGGVLQEPGPEADAVLLATADALVSIPLDGGAGTTTAATRDAAPGDPARPVRHQGCDYAAWAGSGAYVRVCEDPAQNTDMVVDTLKGAGDVQFRTNRTRIVLNDIGTGSVWLPDQHMVLMDDWDQVEADLKAAEQPEDSPQLTDEIVDPERKESNTPPEAVDDEFGIRPGRTTTLPVLQNDSDPDGDVLTARPVTQPDQGTINATRGGQALQVTGIGEDATGTLSFTYEASDGQAVDTASVNATV
ncbi:MAG: cadherin-like domain-containing protein, partial [Actinomyces sp.]|nr:cadherin-like domain-containing protein [Actinomyces sp.]